MRLHTLALLAHLAWHHALGLADRAIDGLVEALGGRRLGLGFHAHHLGFRLDMDGIDATPDQAQEEVEDVLDDVHARQASDQASERQDGTQDSPMPFPGHWLAMACSWHAQRC